MVVITVISIVLLFETFYSLSHVGCRGGIYHKFQIIQKLFNLFVGTFRQKHNT